ncbi:EamA family transporter [Halosegnis marinus]|uniref:EamA family transporter n=1 Tax=Halosegnis marinus TaxID=3034023 RepID=A0ABD5ZS23_9EURY|nr:EamA family transporter [Halosegnis sp. DT85]
MRYLPYALLGLAAYTFVAPLTKLATRDLPSTTVALVTNGMLAVAALAVVLATNGNPVASLTHPDAKYMFAAGAFLSVGIIAYYRALALGPVSVVVPVFGTFLVTSAAAGVFLLDEPLTARKVAGVALAIVAVYLVAVE